MWQSWSILVGAVLLALLVITAGVWRWGSIYVLVAVWDTLVRPWRNRQNEQLRRLALEAQGASLENKSFGVCPGMIPAELFPLPEVRALTLELQQAHNQIAGELGLLMARGERGKAIREIDPRLVRGGTLASRSFPPFTPLLPLRSRGLL
jgi:hypothetical protein